MPKRLIDGEALWGSDKLAKVSPPEFKAEYANLFPLALADGWFECNPRRVWSMVYSYNRPDMTQDLVEEILDEFERVDLLVRKTDEAGKCWGYWVGIEKEGRLPPQSQKTHHKQGKPCFINEEDDVKALPTQSPDNAYVGLVGLGKDRIGEDRSESVVSDSSETPSDNEIGKYLQGAYKDKKPKDIHKDYIVKAWQAVKGAAAVAKYPARYPESWEELCENHPADLIVPAFELWAHEEGKYSNTVYPVSEFLRVAAKFMDRVLPTKKLNREEEMAALVAAETETLRQKNEEEFERLRRESTVTEDIFG